MKKEAVFGLILLVFGSLPENENPPNPTTAEGIQMISTALVESLNDHWMSMISGEGTIPVLLLSCPEFDEAVSGALVHPTAKKYREGLLHWIKIPKLDDAQTEELEALLALVQVRRQILKWLAEHMLEVVQVQPITNWGAKVDHKILQYCAQEQLPHLTRAKHHVQDIRPLIIEVVPFDGKEGPILGLYKGDGDPRPALMPTAEWYAQNYHPQVQDLRATGTIYFNVPLTRFFLKDSLNDELTPLDHWSMKPLIAVAKSAWQDQLGIFESALSELVILLRTRPIDCPPERGLREFRKSPHLSEFWQIEIAPLSAGVSDLSRVYSLPLQQQMIAPNTSEINPTPGQVDLTLGIDNVLAQLDPINLETSACRGDAIAQCNWAVWLESEGDYTNAAQWYLKAAQQGDPHAQYNLAVLLQNGKGVKRNLKEAIDWYQKAASQGYVNAMYNLAYMLENGQGCFLRHRKEAFVLYKKAVQCNDPDSQCRVALLLLTSDLQTKLGAAYQNRGWGFVHSDNDEARRLLYSAAATGHRKSIEILRDLDWLPITVKCRP